MLEEIPFAGDVAAGFETELIPVKGADNISLGIYIASGEGCRGMGTFMGTGKIAVFKAGNAELAVAGLGFGEAFGVEVELVGVFGDLYPGRGHIVCEFYREGARARGYASASPRPGGRGFGLGGKIFVNTRTLFYTDTAPDTTPSLSPKYYSATLRYSFFP